MTCPSCGHPLHGLGTRCWAGGNGCGWYEGKPTAKPSEPLPFDREDTRSEKAIQAAVRLRWESYGYTVCDMSQSRATQQMPGFPDLVALSSDGSGLIMCEVKSAKGRQSEYQKEFERICGEANVPYIITRHEDAVDEYMRRRAA